MGKAPQRPCLAQGWLVAFFWPLAVGGLLLLFSPNSAVPLLPLAWVFVLIAVVALFKLLGDFAVWAGHWISALFDKRSPYGCPVCGYDIRMTPHRCPECGTRLIWGELPRPSRPPGLRLHGCLTSGVTETGLHRP